MMKTITKFLMCSVLLLSSVDNDGLASAAPNGSSVAADSLEVLYPAVFHEILHHLLTKERVIAGDYQGDFGDATCYAPPVLMAHGLATGDSTQIELARAIIAREYRLIDNFLFNSMGKRRARPLLPHSNCNTSLKSIRLTARDGSGH